MIWRKKIVCYIGRSGGVKLVTAKESRKREKAIARLLEVTQFHVWN
jgi:hypothetical protein